MKSIEISPPRELLFLIDRSGKIEMHTDKIFKDQYSEVQSLRRQLSVQQNLDLSPVVVMQDEYPNLFEINRVLGQARTRTLLLEMKDQCITPAIKNINRHAGLDPASIRNHCGFRLEFIPNLIRGRNDNTDIYHCRSNNKPGNDKQSKK